MKVRDIIKAIEKDGWTIKRARGSHRQFTHPAKKGKVTVNGHPGDDVRINDLKSIERQSELKF